MIYAHRCNHKLKPFGGDWWSHKLLWAMFLLTRAAPRSAARPATPNCPSVAGDLNRMNPLSTSTSFLWFCVALIVILQDTYIWIHWDTCQKSNSANTVLLHCHSLLAWCLVAVSQFLAALLAAGPWKCEDEIGRNQKLLWLHWSHKIPLS